jgi:DNA gyrase/topoisomerase IV subunit A
MDSKYNEQELLAKIGELTIDNARLVLKLVESQDDACKYAVLAATNAKNLHDTEELLRKTIEELRSEIEDRDATIELITTELADRDADRMAAKDGFACRR